MTHPVPVASNVDKLWAAMVASADPCPVHSGNHAQPAITRERRLRLALLGLGTVLLSSLAGFGLPRAGAMLGPLCSTGLSLLPLLAGIRLIDDRSPRARRVLPWLLIGGLPFAIAVGALCRPAQPTDVIVFWLEAASLVAFVVEATRLVADLERPLALAAFGEGESRPRLHRRERLYQNLVRVAGVAFVLPLVHALSGGAATPRLAVATAGLLGALTCRAFLIDPLERHLQHDPALVQSLARLRRHARRGRPGAVFYAAATVALAGMLVLVSRRLLGLEGTGL